MKQSRSKTHPIPRIPLFSRTLSSEKGVVLMMVLWIVVFLSVIVAEMAQSMRTELMITRNLKEEAEARGIAEAGVSLAFAEILKDYDYAALGANNDTILVTNKSLIDPEDEGDKKETNRKGIPFHTGTIEYSIIDEERKININTANEATWKKLLETAGLDMGSERDSIVDAIMDWKDENDLFRLNGAEDDYYMSLPEPYHCKNGNFDTVDELLLVKGVTKELLYGEGDLKGIAEYLTVFASGTINLNTASAEVLNITQGEVRAAEILEKREANDGVYDKTQKSGTFTIESTASVATIIRKIKLVCRKSGTGDKATVQVLFWNDDVPI